MTFIATPATSMKFFLIAVVAMAWAVVFLFLAIKFLFTTPIIAGLAIGLVALLYATGALVVGTARHMRETVHANRSTAEQNNASRMFTGSVLVGSLAIFGGMLGQTLSTWFAVAFLSGLWGLWLGLMIFGVVIQLYGQAAYLRNFA
jgi:hypothetical protein